VSAPSCPEAIKTLAALIRRSILSLALPRPIPCLHTVFSLTAAFATPTLRRREREGKPVPDHLVRFDAGGKGTVVMIAAGMCRFDFQWTLAPQQPGLDDSQVIWVVYLLAASACDLCFPFVCSLFPRYSSFVTQDKYLQEAVGVQLHFADDSVSGECRTLDCK